MKNFSYLYSNMASINAHVMFELTILVNADFLLIVSMKLDKFDIKFEYAIDLHCQQSVP